MMLLAQDLPLDPLAIAEELGKAQNVQQVLAIVVGVLLLFLMAVVWFHVREARRWEVKYERRLTKNEKTWATVRDAIEALAGMDSSAGEEDEA